MARTVCGVELFNQSLLLKVWLHRVSSRARIEYGSEIAVLYTLALGSVVVRPGTSEKNPCPRVWILFDVLKRVRIVHVPDSVQDRRSSLPSLGRDKTNKQDDRVITTIQES